VKRSASILLVDDDEAFRSVMSRELSGRGYHVTKAKDGKEALEQLQSGQPDVALLDLQLPDMSGLEVLRGASEVSPGTEVIMLTGHGNIDTAIESIRRGAYDYLAKPCPMEELEVRIRRALERQHLSRRTSVLERGLTPRDPGEWLVGQSTDFRKLLEMADRVALSDSTVLVSGETGSGKEMVAKLLHARSGRAKRPFVVVECAALQEELLQSELFGHERGAFTGADRKKPGLFEVADGGTIFLDEIGEVSPTTQVKLLRVLDSSTFRHVGGTSEINVDVRVVAATNRDLEGMVRQGLFREDLFYRLSTIILKVPPLRERGDDIDLLADHFIKILNDRFSLRKRIGPHARELLRLHGWPGNVRELLHAVERALVLCEGDEIGPEHLPGVMRSREEQAGAKDEIRLHSLAEVEKEHIERVLGAVNGHRGRAAGILGISERNLYRKLKTYGL
jgi:DNA-binding NtrC family response regulator